MWKELLDALADTLWLVPWLLVMHVLIEIFEIHSVSGRKLRKALRGPLAPLIGGVSGLLPQCGFGVVAADLYSRRTIRLGTMIAVFVSTSDEAIPILIGNATKASWGRLGLLLVCKLVAALVAGYALNFLLRKREILAADDGKDVVVHGCHRHAVGEHDEADHAHTGRGHAHHAEGEALAAEAHARESEAHTHVEGEGYSCGSPVEAQEGVAHTASPSDEHAHTCAEKPCEKKKFDVKCYVVHPILHTLTVAGYILAVNVVFALVIYFVGEARLQDFLSASRLYQPFLAGLVGMIPNCASSVILAQMFARGSITLGAAFAGLGVNAGLGLAVLLRKNKPVRHTLWISLGLYAYCTLVGLGLSFLG